MAIEAALPVNHFQLNGVNYFRGRAGAVQLGDAGERKTLGAQERYLSVYASVPRAKLSIARASQIDVHSLALADNSFAASLVIPGVGSLGGASVARQLEDRTLALVKLETLPQDLVAAANESPMLIPELVRAGAAARLVHQTFVVLEMKTALAFARATRFEVSGSVKAWAIAASGADEDARRTVVTIAAGSTFAYLLLKLKWNATQKKHWQRIDAWEEDPWSLP